MLFIQVQQIQVLEVSFLFYWLIWKWEITAGDMIDFNAFVWKFYYFGDRNDNFWFYNLKLLWVLAWHFFFHFVQLQNSTKKSIYSYDPSHEPVNSKFFMNSKLPCVNRKSIIKWKMWKPMLFIKRNNRHIFIFISKIYR